MFIGLTETHLNTNHLDGEIKIDGYNCVRSDRNGRSHGGVCLYLDKSLKYYTIKAISNGICEALLVKVKYMECYISVIYRPSSCNVKHFLEIITTI